MSQSSVHCECRYANNYTLVELSRMIQQRATTIRGETTENAVRATAINVLTSIKARTSKKKNSTKVLVAPEGTVTIRVDASKHPSFANRRRVIRQGPKGAKGGEVFTSLNMVQLVPPTEKWTNANVYVVELRPGMKERWPYQKETYPLVAMNYDAAESYCVKRYTKIANKAAGAARYTLALAQAKVSDRGVSGGPGGENAERIANSHNDVVCTGGGGGSSGQFAVSVADTLCYAMDALEGGAATLDLAMQKAANSTAGIINRYIERAGVFHQRVEPPFKDVVGR